MGRIVLKDVFVIENIIKSESKFNDCVIVYGQIPSEEVLKIGDELIDESSSGFKCKIINFPLLRKIPYLEDHIYIIIKPTVPGYALEDIRRMTLINLRDQ